MKARRKMKRKQRKEVAAVKATMPQQAGDQEEKRDM